MAFVLAEAIPLLDAGYVRFVEAWGHGDAGIAVDGFEADMEAGIIEAARQSTQGSFRGWEEDVRLLAYLYKNKHNTPFEFAGMVLEVQAPIVSFREWQRHRTQWYNEMSARYAPLPELVYVPTTERLLMGGGNLTTQAAGIPGAAQLTALTAQAARDKMIAHSMACHMLYQELLDAGVAKEIARGVLPLYQYSRMRAGASLRNWLAFLTLRMDPKAMYEIRVYANAVGQIIAKQFPKTWELFGRGG
jgi:thymidylate synthase (FAD)